MNGWVSEGVKMAQGPAFSVNRGQSHHSLPPLCSVENLSCVNRLNEISWYPKGMPIGQTIKLRLGGEGAGLSCRVMMGGESLESVCFQNSCPCFT